MLGEFVLSGLRRARRGEVEVEVTFGISADGIVNVIGQGPGDRAGAVDHPGGVQRPAPRKRSSAWPARTATTWWR